MTKHTGPFGHKTDAYLKAIQEQAAPVYDVDVAIQDKVTLLFNITFKLGELTYHTIEAAGWIDGKNTVLALQFIRQLTDEVRSLFWEFTKDDS